MKVIDLEKIKKTRIDLADIVRRYPRLCEGSGNWANELNQLEDIVLATQNERMAKYRNKQREKGLKPITIYINPQAQAVLDRLQYESPEATMGDLISDSLIALDMQKSQKNKKISE